MEGQTRMVQGEFQKELERIAQVFRKEKEELDYRSIAVENQLKEVKENEQRLKNAYSTLLQTIEVYEKDQGSTKGVISNLRQKFELEMGSLGNSNVSVKHKGFSPRGLIRAVEGDNYKCSQLRVSPPRKFDRPLFAGDKSKDRIKKSTTPIPRGKLNVTPRVNGMPKVVINKKPNEEVKSVRSKNLTGKENQPITSTRTARDTVISSKNSVKSVRLVPSVKNGGSFTVNNSFLQDSTLSRVPSTMDKLRANFGERMASPAKSPCRSVVDRVLTRIIQNKNVHNLEHSKSNIGSFISIREGATDVSPEDKSLPLIGSPTKRNNVGTNSPFHSPTRVNIYSPHRKSQSIDTVINRESEFGSHSKIPKIRIDLGESEGDISSIQIASHDPNTLHITLGKKSKAKDSQAIQAPNSARKIIPMFDEMDKHSEGHFGSSVKRNLFEDVFASKNHNSSIQMQNSVSSYRLVSQKTIPLEQESQTSSERSQILRDLQHEGKTNPLSFNEPLNMKKTKERATAQFKSDHKIRDPATKILISPRGNNQESVMDQGSASKSRPIQNSQSRNPLSSADRERSKSKSHQVLKRQGSIEELWEIEKIQNQINHRFQTIEDKITGISNN